MTMHSNTCTAVIILCQSFLLFCVICTVYRSLVPRKIRIWYDDGRGGLDSGHLSLGQVSDLISLSLSLLFFHLDREITALHYNACKV
jgi:hypothetical protein